MAKATSTRARMQLHDERGASAVEFAMVLPILIVLLAGVMDFGLVFSHLMSLRQGIGAGVRQGVVAQAGTASTCTITGASGASLETRRLICLTKDMIGLDEATSRTMISFPDTKQKGGSMILCAQYPLDSTTQIFESLMSGELKAKVEMRIEQDLTAFDSVAETALSGGDWSWCS